MGNQRINYSVTIVGECENESQVPFMLSLTPSEQSVLLDTGMVTSVQPDKIISISIAEVTKYHEQT